MNNTDTFVIIKNYRQQRQSLYYEEPAPRVFLKEIQVSEAVNRPYIAKARKTYCEEDKENYDVMG